MCTGYDVHNHHMKLKRKGLLFAGLSTRLQSTIIVDKCSPFEITHYKNAWDLKEEWEKSTQVSEKERKNEIFVLDVRGSYVYNLNGLNTKWEKGMNTVVLLEMNMSSNELLLHCTIETDEMDFHGNKRRTKIGDNSELWILRFSTNLCLSFSNWYPYIIIIIAIHIMCPSAFQASSS